MLADHEEILDVVNADDEVIGQVNHAQIYRDLSALGGYLRSVNLFLVNRNGDIWIPRRAAHKQLKPNALDYSAGGHVATGETYRQAMVREIEEELGWQVDQDRLLYFGTLPPSPARDYYFCGCFALYSDETPLLSPTEFSGAEWLSVSELRRRLTAGDDAKESMRGTLELWLAHQAQHGSHK